jgi:alpha-L-rhamnosidase
MTGWLKISIKGTKGDTITMRFAETLKSKDSLYMLNIRHAKVTDKYILKGALREVWEPRFSYHGFRFVEIAGLKYAPSVNDFTGKVIYDNIPTTGSFESSNKTLNQIYTNAYWTIRSNYRGMPADCPQRDERMGWLGDRSANSYGESFLFDNSRLYAKWMYDIKDAQKESGSIPDVVPTYWKMYNDNVTWPSTFIIIPAMLRKQFGDMKTFSDNYSAMKKWMLYMWNNYRTDDLILRDNYGDWCLPPESLDIIVSKDPTRNAPGPLLASAYYYYCLQLMGEYAASFGYQADKEKFSEMAQKVNVAFNNKFYHADSTYYDNNAVTSNLLPLTFGLAPEKDRKAIFNRIVQRTLNMYDGHVSTGLVGGQWLMRGLSDNGRPDLAYRIASNTTYPSWGYMIAQGATTIWELWNGNTANPAMNSGNHVMLLGDLLIWYYEYLGGIKSDDQEVAFKKIIMNPYFAPDLTYVNASYQSPYGLIESKWGKSNKVLNWAITVPANASAIVYIPGDSEKVIMEGDKPATMAKGVRFLMMQNGKAMFEVGSGSYSFSAKTN